MLNKFIYGILTIFLITCLPASAGEIVVNEPWLRATVNKQKVSAGFMLIEAKDQITLIKATSPLSDNVEIHQMSMDGGVMRMRKINDLTVEAGKTLSLQPGGYHLMLFALKEQIKLGNKYPIKLYFKNAKGSEEVVEINAEAKK